MNIDEKILRADPGVIKTGNKCKPTTTAGGNTFRTPSLPTVGGGHTYAQ